MVVKLRLQRFGRKHLPFYRIVVADSRCPRDGKFIEKVNDVSTSFFLANTRYLLKRFLHVLIPNQIGTYNPIPTKDGVKELTANSDRVHYWITCGAQPSDRVAWLFGQIGLLPQPPVRQKTKSLLPKAVLKAQK